MTIRAFYDRWPQYERRLRETIAPLTDEQLAFRAAPDHWPIWAIVCHLAGSRVYWLCTIAGEPGAESTPWPKADGEGWEDDMTRPRSAAELVEALESTFAIIDRVLDTWDPDDLNGTFERTFAGVVQVHSRASILQRILTHEAYHDGEVAIALGSNGLDPVYIWRPYPDEA